MISTVAHEDLKQKDHQRPNSQIWVKEKLIMRKRKKENWEKIDTKTDPWRITVKIKSTTHRIWENKKLITKKSENKYNQKKRGMTFQDMVFRANRRVPTNITDNSAMDFTGPSSHTGKEHRHHDKQGQHHHHFPLPLCLHLLNVHWLHSAFLDTFIWRCCWICVLGPFVMGDGSSIFFFLTN